MHMDRFEDNCCLYVPNQDLNFQWHISWGFLYSILVLSSYSVSIVVELLTLSEYFLFNKQRPSSFFILDDISTLISHHIPHGSTFKGNNNIQYLNKLVLYNYWADIVSFPRSRRLTQNLFEKEKIIISVNTYY